MQDLSLHVLDIAENALRAGARTVEVRIFDDADADRLTLLIEDDGAGMDATTVTMARDPFFSTKDGKRTGLGLSLLSQAAEATGGHVDIASATGRGTTVTAVFRPSHPDMKPLGDIVETFGALLAANPEVHFVFDCRTGNKRLYFDTEQITEEAHHD